MTVHKAGATWQGGIKDGQGTITVESAQLQAPYSFGTRFNNDSGSNPEELLGAAHASCYAMALSKMLGDEGYSPQSIHAAAEVSLENKDDGYAITRSDLVAKAEVPDIDDIKFQEIAEKAKEGCLVSQALGELEIGLEARLMHNTR